MAVIIQKKFERLPRGGVCLIVAQALFCFPHPALSVGPQALKINGIRGSSSTKTLQEWVAETIAEADLSVSGKLSLDLITGLEIGGRATRKVEPAYRGKEFVREDRFEFKTQLDAAEMASQGLPVSMGVEHAAEVRYVRRFNSQGEALKSKPDFDPRRLPLNSALANQMREGEVAIIPMRLGFFLGAKGSMPVGHLPVSISHEQKGLVMGRSEVKVIKLENNKVLVNMSLLHEKGVHVKTGAEADIDVFNVSAFDKLLQKATLSVAGAEQRKQWLQGVRRETAYLFDFDDPDSRAAYDDLIGVNGHIRHVEMIAPQREKRPHLNGRGTASSLPKPPRSDEPDQPELVISDPSAADRLARADANRGIGERRVTAMDAIHSEFDSRAATFNAGGRLASYRLENNALAQRLTYRDVCGEVSNYEMTSTKFRKDTNLFFGFHREREMRQVTFLHPVPGESLEKSERYVVSLEITDKTLRAAEVSDLHEYLRGKLPRDIIDHLALENDFAEGQKHQYARASIDLIFNQRFVDELRTWDEKRLTEAFEQYVRKNRELLPEKANVLVKSVTQKSFTHRRIDWLDKHREALKSAPQLLAQVFAANAGADPENRTNQFEALQNNEVFKRIGTGFLFSLLPPDRLNEFVYVRSETASKTISKTVPRTFGSEDPKVAQNVLRFVRRAHEDNSYDPRTLGSTEAIEAELARCEAPPTSNPPLPHPVRSQRPLI